MKLFYLIIVIIKFVNCSEILVEVNSVNDALCSQIGFENAILNKCGYCTEGETGLDIDYGTDQCNKECNNDSFIDCNNVCNGDSYIDPCNGYCIDPSKNNCSSDELRDCRGLCIGDINEFILDECGSCESIHSFDNFSTCEETVIGTETYLLNNDSNFSLALKTNDTSPPEIDALKSFVTENGLSIVIVLSVASGISVDKPMYSKDCESIIMQNTLLKLKSYNIIDCIWTTKVQLLITLGLPINDLPLNVSLSIDVIENKAKKVNRLILDALIDKSILDEYRFQSGLALIGPTTMPVCGAFTINGYFSSPQGITGVRFKWSIATLPPRIELVSDQLLNIINTNEKLSLELKSEMFSLEPYSYKFTLEAYLTDHTILVATHQIFKYNFHSPIVTIIPTTLLLEDYFTKHQSAYLFSEVSLPNCITNPKPITYQWKINNPRVKFNFSMMSLPYYYISENTLPTESIKFELHTSMDSKTSISSITLNPTLRRNLVSILNGITVISTGNESGRLDLNASIFVANSERAKLAFQWSCHYQNTNQPCLSNVKSNESKSMQLLLFRENINAPHISLNSYMFRESAHLFGLHVFYANSTKSDSYNAYVIVNVVKGKVPIVMIGEVYIDNKYLINDRNNNSNVIKVPSHTLLVIKAIIRNLEHYRSHQWLSSNSIFALQYTNKIVGNQLYTYLYLHSDHVLPYSEHNITLKACNFNGVCSKVNKLLIAGPVVSECALLIDSLTVTPFTMSKAIIDKCNIPQNRAPILYQLFITNHNSNILIPLSRPQYSPVINFYLPNISIETNLFSVEVCDNYKHCQLFNSSVNVSIDATENQTLSESESFERLINESQRYSSAGDPISAITALTSVLTDQNLFNKDIINELVLEYSSQLSSKDIRTKGDLSLILYVFGELFKHSNHFETKSIIIETLMNITKCSDILVDQRTLKLLYINILNFSRFDKKSAQRQNSTGSYANNMDIAYYLSNIRYIFHYIINSMAKQLSIGSEVRFGESEPFPNAITYMGHKPKLSDCVISARYTDWKNVSANVKFNDAYIIRTVFANSIINFEPIRESVVYAITLFPNENFYVFEQKTYRLTPIVEISIHSPISGNKLEVTANYNDYIAIVKLTITGNQSYGDNGYITKCHYYNEATNKWDMEGIIELGISGSNAGCLLYHLSSVVILRVVETLNSDYIFGVLVAVLMGVLIFTIMTVFFVQKRADTTTRVAPMP